MKVKSTLDCCDEGEEGEMAETDIVASAAAPSTQLGTDNDCDMDEVAVATRAPETVQEVRHLEFKYHTLQLPVILCAVDASNTALNSYTLL